MNNKSTVALLGATGKAGQYILKALLEQGYPVKALIRQPDTFTVNHPQLQNIPGDAKDPETVQQLIAGCKVVMAAIGPRQGEPLIASLSTKNILAAMKTHGSQRLIVLAGLNLDVPGDQKSEATQAATDWMLQNFPEAVADRQKAYEILTQSTANWTMLRLPMIEQTDQRRGVIVDLLDNPSEKIGTTDLADFMIAQIDDRTFIGKAPFLASK